MLSKNPITDGKWPWLAPGLALLAVYGLVYLQTAAALAGFPYDWDQGEGYDAWSAWLIDRGQLPYSANDRFPYYSSNYPPVWSYLVSIPLAWTGPGLAAGRLISATAALSVAIVLALAARRRGGSWLAGGLAGGFFLASPYVVHATPLARVNALTLLFSVLALWAFERPSQRRVGLGVLALLSALFTKQTAADAAVACLVSALIATPRRGVAASIALGSAGALGLALLNWATEGAFWLNVVAGNANPFDGRQLVDYLRDFTVLHGLILALASVEAFRAVRSREWSPWVLYFLLSAVASLGVAKVGAGESYFLGLIASACVLAASSVVRLLRVGSHPGLVGAALVVQGLTLAHGPLQLPPLLVDRSVQSGLLGRTPSVEDRRAGDEIVRALRRWSGPVLVEDPSFAVAAGKPVVGNATHLRNLYDAGLWDATEMVSDLAARRYDTVVLNAQMYPQPVLDAIGRHYYLEQTVVMNGFSYQLFRPGSE